VVLTPDTLVTPPAGGTEFFVASRAVLARLGLPSSVSVPGLKGSLVYPPLPATNYREFLAIDTAISHLNYLVQHNNGVFLAPWAKSESWTLSVAHTSDDGARLTSNTSKLARMLDGLDGLADVESELFEVGGVT
jgi:glutamate-1-semialdehyde 2,1-aminomutase